MSSSRHAVVVGVGKYQDSRIEELHGAQNDARELRDKLVGDGEFDIPDGAFLIDDEATSLAIRNAVSDLLWCTDKKSLSLFYFSGHGFQDNYGHGYLAPHDLIYDRPLVHGFRMQELKELLLKAKNKDSIVLILDCCYSGIVAEGERNKAVPASEPVKLDAMFEGLDNYGAAAGRIVLASSGQDEKSREVPTCIHEIGSDEPHCHGAFTFQLLEGLDGRAAEQDGKVTLEGIHRFVEERMDKDHRPSFYGSGVHDARNIVVARASQLSGLQKSLEAVRTKIQRNQVLEFFDALEGLADVLARAPKLPAARDLRGEVDSILRRYQHEWDNFLVSHIKEIMRETDGETFAWLRNTVLSITFDSAKAESKNWAVLDDLCNAARERIDLVAYLARLKAARSRIASPSPEAQRPLRTTKGESGN